MKKRGYVFWCRAFKCQVMQCLPGLRRTIRLLITDVYQSSESTLPSHQYLSKEPGVGDEKEKISLKPVYENHLPLLLSLGFLLINIAEHKRGQLLIEDKLEIS